ncbi:phage virion morphogenesis protein [Dickeya dianthicola]|uniref:phage virion morphogenesis protein n=1 Tax=Dickeya dianthicola TaxID=204039 RepID=UPI003BF8FA27
MGSAQRLARVHHYGLRDRVREHGPVVKYAARQLLGMDTELINHILNKLHVSIK